MTNDEARAAADKPDRLAWLGAIAATTFHKTVALSFFREAVEGWKTAEAALLASSRELEAARAERDEARRHVDSMKSAIDIARSLDAIAVSQEVAALTAERDRLKGALADARAAAFREASAMLVADVRELNARAAAANRRKSYDMAREHTADADTLSAYATRLEALAAAPSTGEVGR